MIYHLFRFALASLLSHDNHLLLVLFIERKQNIEMSIEQLTLKVLEPPLFLSNWLCVYLLTEQPHPPSPSGRHDREGAVAGATVV